MRVWGPQEVIARDTEIVQALRLALAERVGAERFQLWFGGNAEFAIESHQLRVIVQSDFYQDWLRTRFRDHLEGACQTAVGRALPIVFEVDANLAQRAAAAAGTPPSAPALAADTPAAARPQPAPTLKLVGGTTPVAPPAKPRRRYGSFDTLVVGASNRLAYVSAMGVVDRLGSISPLVIHGPTGSGKTHLLEGIWQAARRTHRDAQPVYLTAEQFTTTFLEALQGGGLPAFRRKFRGTQLLIVDDVQFFIGKRATLQEVVTTVDTLLREGRQLVFSADRPPAELDALGPELKTRLQGGLVCGIEPAEFETRLGIVRRMADDLELVVPEDVLRFIAQNFCHHARELAGALKRLNAVSLAMRQPISLALAENHLGEMIRQQARVVRLPDIERVVCQMFGLEPQSLQTQGKGRDRSQPRMLAMWLARKYTRAALSEIGQYFGGRRHSTVISAQKKVDEWVTSHNRLRLADGGAADAEDILRRLEDGLMQVAG